MRDFFFSNFELKYVQFQLYRNRPLCWNFSFSLRSHIIIFLFSFFLQKKTKHEYRCINFQMYSCLVQNVEVVFWNIPVQFFIVSFNTIDVLTFRCISSTFLVYQLNTTTQKCWSNLFKMLNLNLKNVASSILNIEIINTISITTHLFDW